MVENSSLTDQLLTACCVGRVEEVEKLLQIGGADPNALGTTNGWTSLCSAVYHNNIEVAKCLLDNGAEVNKLARNLSLLPLRSATESGHWRMVDFLLKNGANVNVKCRTWRQTPLMGACKVGTEAEKCVEILLQAGANSNQKDSQGNTPLMFASRSLFVSDKIIQLLFESGADVNAVNKRKETAIHIAIENLKFPHLTQLLMANFDNVNAADQCGRTVIFKMCQFNLDIELLKSMLDKKADLTIRANNNFTPLMAACEAKSGVDVLKLLVDHGESVNAINDCGFTPLMCACRRGKLEQVEFLLENGAQVNVETQSGKTALVVLCQSVRKSEERLRIAQSLISKGAKINLTKWSPLLNAIITGDIELANVLIDHGADVNFLGRFGDSQLEIAIKLISQKVDIPDSKEFPIFLQRLRLLGSHSSDKCLIISLSSLSKTAMEHVVESVFPIEPKCHLMKSTFESATNGKIRQTTRNQIFLMKNMMENQKLIDQNGSNLPTAEFPVKMLLHLFNCHGSQVEPLFTATICTILEDFTKYSKYENDNCLTEAAKDLKVVLNLLEIFPLETLSFDNLRKILRDMEKARLLAEFAVLYGLITFEASGKLYFNSKLNRVECFRKLVKSVFETISSKRSDVTVTFVDTI